MKKNVWAIVTILMLCCLVGCSKKDQNAVSSHASNTITLGSSNAYTLNYTNLYDKTISLVNNTAINSNDVEFYFRPDGLITYFCMRLGTLEKNSNETNHYIGDYKAFDYMGLRWDGDKGVSSVKVSGTQITTFATYLDKNADYSAFKKLMSDLDSFDLQALINTYRVGNPVFYFFVTKPQSRDAILDGNANTIYLHRSAGGLQKVAKPDSYTEDNLTFKNYDYYLLMPYYEKTDSMSGVNEITVGQSNAVTYVGKNLLVILKDKA